MRSRIAILAALASIPVIATAQQPHPAASWRVRSDGASSDSASWQRMPPGWHLTTTSGAGAILYDPGSTATDRYALQMEVFLFPGEGGDRYGVFAGGRQIDGTAPAYVAFLVRRDGSVAIERIEGTVRTPVVAGMASAAVKRPPNDQDNVLTLLRVSVERDSVRFSVNGDRIATLARDGLPLDGTFGIRAGAGVNLHISNLDITHRLAPAPSKR